MNLRVQQRPANSVRVLTRDKWLRDEHLGGVFPALFAEVSSATDRTTTLRSTPKSADNPPKAALVQHESANGGSTPKRYKPINHRHLATLFALPPKAPLHQPLLLGPPPPIPY